jgi:hypothetical protein
VVEENVAHLQRKVIIMTARFTCWKTSVVIAGLLLTASAAVAQDLETKKSFEGVLEVQAQNTERVQIYTYFVKNGRIRVEPANVADASQVILVDHQSKKTYVLLQAREEYIEIANAADVGREPTGLQKTDVTDEILGYTCDRFLVKSSQVEVELWATKELGMAGTMLTTIVAGTFDTPSWETELLSMGYFPMKVVIRDASGYEAGKFEVNTVQKKALGDYLFRVPKGYEKVEKNVLEPKQAAPKKKRTR